MNSFTGFLKKNSYFSGITISRRGLILLSMMKNRKDEKKKVIEPKLSRFLRSVYGSKITSKEMSLYLMEVAFFKISCS